MTDAINRQQATKQELPAHAFRTGDDHSGGQIDDTTAPNTDAGTPSDADRHVVAGQIKRTPRAMAGVGARCVHGFPAVTKQAPEDDRGRPFPTACYLTCPHLVKQIDRIEAGGGVRRYEALLAENDELRAATDAAHDRHGEITGRGFNIAATTNREHLKCLHAHAAFALAHGDHPLGDRVLAEAAPRWCDDARCASLLDAPAPE